MEQKSKKEHGNIKCCIFGLFWPIYIPENKTMCFFFEANLRRVAPPQRLVLVFNHPIINWLFEQAMDPKYEMINNDARHHFYPFGCPKPIILLFLCGKSRKWVQNHIKTYNSLNIPLFFPQPHLFFPQHHK